MNTLASTLEAPFAFVARVLMRKSEWEAKKKMENRQNENRVEKSWIIFISTHKKNGKDDEEEMMMKS